jgi:DNA-binding GntR family transcriptional regulator
VTPPQFPWISEAQSHEEPVPSMAQRVREQVVRMIMAGEIKSGQRISEPDIAKRLGVSRVPVREALRSLDLSGLVTTRINAGVFVRQLSPREIHELYQIRALLDSHAAEVACGLPAEEHKALIEILGSYIDAMAETEANGNTPLYYEKNLLFHWEIIRCCKNKKLMEIYQSVTQQLHLCRASNLSISKSRSASLAEHRELFNAIAAGNRSLAARAAEAHADLALKRLENP